jgi:hypothetical protein
MRIGLDGKAACADEGVNKVGAARTPALAAIMRRRVGYKNTSPMSREALPALVCARTLVQRL